MTGMPPSILSHVSLGTNRFEQATGFYDAVLAPLKIVRVMDLSDAVAYGRQFPEFWVQKPADGNPAQTANGMHVAFLAHSRGAVQAFWDAALERGGQGEGEPGPRPHYGAPYYGCFVRDLDGHKIEAMFWDPSIADDGHSPES